MTTPPAGELGRVHRILVNGSGVSSRCAEAGAASAFHSPAGISRN